LGSISRKSSKATLADVAEMLLDLARLGLPRRRELVEDGLLQRLAGPHVTQHAGQQDGERTEQQQGGEELGRQSPSRRTIEGGRRDDRHRTHLTRGAVGAPA